ncbi:hypothetical protein AB1E22_07940 [Buttiauxella gaviniae]|uniref:DNA utilization protein HofO C-terminal domain-containing protein n=1 Tax=Buttiauxella gaviniae TaxID=82990 RepID=A0ABV3NT86_9ENTR
MPWLIERWLSGPSWLRLALFVGVILSIALVAWLSLIRPQHLRGLQLTAENEQTGQRISELRRKIRQLTSEEQPLMEPKSPVFSVTEFVALANGQLVKWQPDEKQGALEMRVPWEKLPGLFARLAAYRVVAGHSFTVTPEGDWLKLALTMEFPHEP